MKIMKKVLYIAIFVLFFFTHAQAQNAPPFSLPTDTGVVSLAALKGKVVYVDFWATWCVPCRKSFPWMNEMNAKYKKQGLEIIAISMDSKREKVKKFLEKVPANFTIAYDPEGEIADAYKVQVMPSSFIIDRKGKLIEKHYGFRAKDKPELEKALQAALR